MPQDEIYEVLVREKEYPNRDVAMMGHAQNENQAADRAVQAAILIYHLAEPQVIYLHHYSTLHGKHQTDF